jgi:hypothetical protein
MDNRKLNETEIALMKQYIASRSYSFKEPGIMAEILDHFACKTEEILNEQKSISFPEAMTMAHKSFGVRGFAPIAAAWEANTTSYYKQWSKGNALRLLLSLHGIGIIALSILVAEIYWIISHNVRLPFNGFEVLITIQVIAAIIVFSNKTGKAIKKKHPLLYGIASQAIVFKGGALFLSLPFVIFSSHAPLMAQALIAGSITFYYAFYCIQQLSLHQKIVAHIQTIALQA